MTSVTLVRRPSPEDPPVGTWAVLGMGDHGTAIRDALAGSGVDVLAFDSRPGTDAGVLWGHHVIAIEEIDDIDALAITSVDLAERVLVTDYVTGVVVSVGAYRDWPFLDPETLNVVTDTPVLAHRMFTPRHPAIVVSGPDAAPALERQAQVVARYAVTLRVDPRAALTFHRRVCARLLPGWPRADHDPAAGQDYDAVLAADLAVLDGGR
ncbi:MAG: hypothetical protein U0R64_05720 [Candidatus Nanopelagicales bacterium]